MNLLSLTSSLLIEITPLLFFLFLTFTPFSPLFFFFTIFSMDNLTFLFLCTIFLLPPSSQQPIPVLCKTIFFSTLANFFKHFHLPEFYPSVLLFISLYALLTPQFTATRFTNILTLINPLYIFNKHLTNIHIHNSIYLTLINPQVRFGDLFYIVSLAG